MEKHTIFEVLGCHFPFDRAAAAASVPVVGQWEDAGSAEACSRKHRRGRTAASLGARAVRCAVAIEGWQCAAIRKPE